MAFLVGLPRPVTVVGAFLSVTSLSLVGYTDGCRAQELEQAEITETVALAATVSLVERREISEFVPLTGTVHPRNEVLVTPQTGGILIRQVLVDVGDWVDQGDLLVRLRRDVYEVELAKARAEEARSSSAVHQTNSQIASAEANAKEAEADHKRITQLFDAGRVSQASMDEAVARVESARAAAASAQDALLIAEAVRQHAQLQREIAEINLSWTEITAPVSGIVGTRTANVGAITSMSGEPLLTIFEGRSLELVAEVLETSLGEIQPGDGGSVDVAGIGPLVGLVRLVSPAVDPRTRLGEVRITLENKAGLRSGLFGSGQIETDRRMALCVPLTAVLSDDQGEYVQVVTDGRVARRAVTTGLVWNRQREIVSGLEEGETVIARSGAFFRNGDRVRMVEPAPGARP